MFRRVLGRIVVTTSSFSSFLTNSSHGESGRLSVVETDLVSFL